MLDWEIDRDWMDCYFKIIKVNSTFYKMEVQASVEKKSISLNIALSSGKKRQHFDNFYDQDSVKRDGGIKALLICKNQIFKFCNEYANKSHHKVIYIDIGWIESKKRDIYMRLEREGFRKRRVNWGIVLSKKIKG